jgi:hypothetical protein
MYLQLIIRVSSILEGLLRCCTVAVTGNMVSRMWAAPFEARHNVAVLLRHKVAAHDVPPILTRPLTSEIEPKFANTATKVWVVEGRFVGDTSVTKL